MEPKDKEVIENEMEIKSQDIKTLDLQKRRDIILEKLKKLTKAREESRYIAEKFFNTIIKEYPFQGK